MTGVPQFGTAPKGSKVRTRPSAYGLLRDAQGRLLICETPECVMLPGGGIDPGEEPEQAMRREVAEETGLVVVTASLLCHANQLIVSRDGQAWLNKTGSYFVATVEDHGGQPVEHDHACLWLNLDDATAALSDEAHRWAVARLADDTLGKRRTVALGGE